MRWLLPIVLLAACADPFTPSGASRFDPPAIYAELWQQVESCSGKSGDWHRVTWFAVPGEQFEVPGGWDVGRWQPAHEIFLSDAGQRTYQTIKHEMLHDLLQTGEHPPSFEACGIR